MKKYLIIAFILIFGIAILSTYITYQKTNSENVIENINPQNIVENVESTNQLQTSVSLSATGVFSVTSFCD